MTRLSDLENIRRYTRREWISVHDVVEKARAGWMGQVSPLSTSCKPRSLTHVIQGGVLYQSVRLCPRRYQNFSLRCGTDCFIAR